MTVEKLKHLIETSFEPEFLNFEAIPPERRFSNRPDLNAFMLLDKLLPATNDMVCSAEHDKIWLSVDVEDLAKVATEENILDLVRSGVIWEEDFDSLAMFV